MLLVIESLTRVCCIVYNMCKLILNVLVSYPGQDKGRTRHIAPNSLRWRRIWS